VLAAPARPAAEAPPPTPTRVILPTPPEPEARPEAAAAFQPAPRKPSNLKACRPARPAYDRRGTASWYGPTLHGGTTASGEPFDMDALTAAHRTLPFGTRVRVTNLENGRAVVLTVNDRGPFADGRLIDVSRRAARELGFLENDLTKVRVEAVRGC
jgi:rare lipoprotein A